ncbi:hypothetical protein HF086_009378 [Spodoptera exigua]|uniref:Uncharacterized protein n=1 Tax=Spodoptera exigua TaxID=7107 RepID=A0A922MJW2_SPOEX|nr:hypothetical protein HF086_009378 [Spodoptera exigua]
MYGVARRGVRGQPVPAVLRELVLQRLARLLFINLDTDGAKLFSEQHELHFKAVNFSHYLNGLHMNSADRPQPLCGDWQLI